MILADLSIPQMFTAYAEDLNYLTNGLHHFQYYCEECDQIFASAWGKIPGSMSFFERGKYFVCPSCGTHHHAHVAYTKRGELVPYKVRLAVKEYKEFVTLEIASEAVFFCDYLNLYARKYYETFRFDIKKQTVTVNFRNGYNESPLQLGNPFNLDIFRLSILTRFTSASLAYKKQQKDLNRILTILRETVHKKLEKHLGHKIASLYVSQGSHGTFLLPIFNIAYRIVCPDAPNLPADYRGDQHIVNNLWRAKMLGRGPQYAALYDSFIQTTKTKGDFISVLCEQFNIPDKPRTRRVIAEDPFSVRIVSNIFKICSNYDNAINLYTCISGWIPEEFYSMTPGIDKKLFNFLADMKRIYGEAGMCRLVSEARELQTKDCIQTYNLLNKENKKALNSKEVSLRDLHDWLSFRHQKQNHKNIEFKVPQHIIKRLSMQTDRLKFFLPKESIELLAAGCELHNCVATYRHSVAENKKQIVLVSDDLGKLVACLEICNKELVQAKIKNNQPVHVDPEINDAIINWAAEAKIKIKTRDVKQQDDQIIVTVSA